MPLKAKKLKCRLFRSEKKRVCPISDQEGEGRSVHSKYNKSMQYCKDKTLNMGTQQNMQLQINKSFFF